MKYVKALLIPFILALTFSSLYASGLAGTCGDGPDASTACNLTTNLSGVFKGALMFMLQVSALVMVLAFVMVGLGYIQASDKAAQLQEAKRRLKNVVLGLLLLTVVASAAFVGVFKYIGVDAKVLDPLRILLQGHALLPSILPFAHAYAADGDPLPNPLGVNNLMAFLVLLLKLVIQWIIFPILVAAWAFTGFKYVGAQGNPQKLADAHKYLWYTFIGTVIIMLAEGLATALSGTITQLFS